MKCAILPFACSTHSLLLTHLSCISSNSGGMGVTAGESAPRSSALLRWNDELSTGSSECSIVVGGKLNSALVSSATPTLPVLLSLKELCQQAG